MISVIVPNTNSPCIGRILEALRNQTLVGTDFEILVIGEDAPGLVTEDARTRSIPTASGTFASDKRNLGMREAEGDIFLFLDDDCTPAHNLLEQHFHQHHQGYPIVGGAVTFCSRSYSLADNVSPFSTICCLSRRLAFDHICRQPT